MAFRAVKLFTCSHGARALHRVLQVWRFVQLLTIVQIRGDLRLVLHVWRFEQLLTTNKEMGTAEVFRKYGVSSTYLP